MPYKLLVRASSYWKVLYNGFRLWREQRRASTSSMSQMLPGKFNMSSRISSCNNSGTLYVGYSVKIPASSVGFLDTTKLTTTLQTLHYIGGLLELPIGPKTTQIGSSDNSETAIDNTEIPTASVASGRTESATTRPTQCYVA